MDLQDKHKIKNDGYFLISPDINEKTFMSGLMSNNAQRMRNPPHTRSLSGGYSKPQ